MVVLILLLLFSVGVLIFLVINSFAMTDAMCRAPELTNPGQSTSTNPYEYFYTSEASFQLNPFQANPAQCAIQYSCRVNTGIIHSHDLCDYSSELTTSKFDPETGLFSFKSTDIMTFWSQTITFEIFATSGESEESFTFDMKLVNPC